MALYGMFEINEGRTSTVANSASVVTSTHLAPHAQQAAVQYALEVNCAWTDLLLTGAKTMEVRAYPLPADLLRECRVLYSVGVLGRLDRITDLIRDSFNPGLLTVWVALQCRHEHIHCGDCRRGWRCRAV